MPIKKLRIEDAHRNEGLGRLKYEKKWCSLVVFSPFDGNSNNLQRTGKKVSVDVTYTADNI